MAKKAPNMKAGRTKKAVDGAVKDANKNSVAKAETYTSKKEKVQKMKLSEMLKALIAGDSEAATDSLHEYLQLKTRDLLGESKDEKDEDESEEDDDDEDDEDDESEEHEKSESKAEEKAEHKKGAKKDKADKKEDKDEDDD